MKYLLRVLIVTVPTGLFAFPAPPLAAADRVALVGCDLTARDGPTATFLQIGGESGNRRGIPIVAEGVAEDVAGRSCARVLAELVEDGFAFRSADVSGRLFDQWVSIWQAGN